MTQKDDHFLAQILDTEKQAAKRIAKATEKAKADLGKYETKLAEKRETNLESTRNESKEQLSAAQVEARGLYEKLTEEGAREAATLEKEMAPKIDKSLSVAQTFFINEVL